MYDHTFFKNLQITRSAIRHHIKWAGSKYIQIDFQRADRFISGLLAFIDAV